MCCKAYFTSAFDILHTWRVMLVKRANIEFWAFVTEEGRGIYNIYKKEVSVDWCLVHQSTQVGLHKVGNLNLIGM